MADGSACDACGSRDLRGVVCHGSYVVMCARCRTGPATSFMGVERAFVGAYRAVVVDDGWHELEVIAEGPVAVIAPAIRSAAHQGKLVELKALPGRHADRAP